MSTSTRPPILPNWKPQAATPSISSTANVKWIRNTPDVLLLERSPFAVKHQHLIELKYVKKGDGAAGWEAKKQEGITQVQGYLQLPTIAALPKLSAWLMLTDSERVEIQRVRLD